MRLFRSLIVSAVLGASFGPPAFASDTPLAPSGSLPSELPPAPSLREQADIRDAWLAERLDTLLPELMRKHGVEMWILVAREYLEDPVMATMFDATTMRARRRTILVFHDRGEAAGVERLTVSRYGMGDFFEPGWTPEDGQDQWTRLGEIVAERDPETIALNISPASAFADGLSKSQYDGLMAALPEGYRDRIVDAHPLAIGWLETRTASEVERYAAIVRTARAIIGEALSDAVIKPGVTTADDVRWWYRQRVAGLGGLNVWFHPSVAVQREGEDGFLTGDTVIRPGDLVWTDFGIDYLGLSTDTQHLAYVLKPGETDAPDGLKAGLRDANRVQDLLTESFEVGLSGNAVLAEARRKALAEGLEPSIYTHPIGHHGHGAGPSIGFWDNQDPDPRGSGPVNAGTAWAIELNATRTVPEWGGQRVEFRTEEDAFFDGETVRYLDGRQTELTLIGG
ncbi:MAG: M24 family metallopeptidase [Pseudomonadota bacterium]